MDDNVLRRLGINQNVFAFYSIVYFVSAIGYWRLYCRHVVNLNHACDRPNLNEDLAKISLLSLRQVSSKKTLSQTTK